MKYMLRTLILSLLFVFSAVAAVSAQRADADTAYQRSGKGASEIVSDGGGQSFVSAYKSSDFKPKGYRVQLIAESGQGSQDRAQATRSAYLSRYKNEHKAYLIFDAPNFKVRVGDFQTKFEAAILWKKLQAEFPNSYVVEDDIHVIQKK
ncbi:MAG: SPOR domain-containing protein [Bacteroidia bacterium]|nr:SPOR domain-containing protein [Bacteroidia bacterium]